MTKPNDQPFAAIDAALADWRQGDCVVEGEHWFVHRKEAGQRAADQESATLVESEVPGFVLITQSCDIVRKYEDRPYVSVSPLAEVHESDLVVIRKGYRPQFAPIPALTAKKLVADLDRVMTVDKHVVAAWPRTKGCANDNEVRDFAKAVARKHGRFAFPDDFNEFVGNLGSRIKEKHGKESAEGKALKALAEIRVRAAPSWDAGEVELMFWFIAKPEDAAEVRKSGILPSWETRIVPKGRFRHVLSQIATYQELTAEDYLESDRLDLDHLSVAPH